MALMGYREYARHRGCSLKAVQKAIDAGRIQLAGVEGDRKRIDSDQADAAWQENTDIAKQSVMHGAGPAAPAGVQTPARAEDEPEDELEDLPELPPAVDPASKEYRDARTAREKLRLQREQREFDLESGKLLPLEDARRIAFTACRQLRDAILHVPARVKDALAAETNPDVVEQLLEGELGAVLGSMDPASLLREGADPDDDDAEQPA